jgi:D-alanine-D-alanine ligase
MTLRSSPRVIVLAGGPSPEAEVSRRSGHAVADALRRRFAHVRVVELEPDATDALREADVVFPALHGCPGEDGTVQGLLEIMGRRYVGSDVSASVVAMDKSLAKLVFRRAGLPVAADLLVDRRLATAAEWVPRVRAALGSHVVIKPTRQGSALGVVRVHDDAQLPAALAQALGDHEVLLVEELVRGREATCGVLETDRGALALPACEVRTPEDSWYDYEHRYAPGGSEHLIPAPFGDALTARVQEVAVAAHRALGCRDLSRVDFVVPETGEPTLLEVNTLPGMTATSLYPDEARAAGWPFDALVEHLVLRAWAR